MRKLLKLICVIQEKDLASRIKRRINPFNPLSYIVIVITLIVAVLMFGCVGMWRELDLRNPFKYL